jgi:hypothetical protein
MSVIIKTATPPKPKVCYVYSTNLTRPFPNMKTGGVIVPRNIYQLVSFVPGYFAMYFNLSSGYSVTNMQAHFENQIPFVAFGDKAASVLDSLDIAYFKVEMSEFNSSAFSREKVADVRYYVRHYADIIRGVQQSED